MNKSIFLKWRGMTFSGICCALLCVCAVITIPIQPVPFTLAVFGLMLIGAIQTPRYALMSTLGYLVLGIIGLPVFSGMQGGAGVLFGATGGYLMAYPLMAFAVSIFTCRMPWKTVGRSLGMAAALVLCYGLGSLWYMFFAKVSLMTAFSLCVLPFIPFDLLKCGLAVMLSAMLDRSGLLRNMEAVQTSHKG